MSLPHKDYVLPDVATGPDEGDPRWHEAHLPGKETGAMGSTPLRNEQGEIYAYQWNGLEPGFWRGFWRDVIADEWARIVAEYEAEPDDAFAAWHYLDHHPVFWRFTDRRENLPVNHVGRLEHEYAMTRGWPEITPHKVNPETGHIEDDKKLNTRLEWWYEFGPWPLGVEGDEHRCAWHDHKLDGGAATYEQAVTEMALKVWTHYGNDRQVVDSEEWRKGGGDGQEETTQGTMPVDGGL